MKLLIVFLPLILGAFGSPIPTTDDTDTKSDEKNTTATEKNKNNDLYNYKITTYTTADNGIKPLSVAVDGDGNYFRTQATYAVPDELLASGKPLQLPIHVIEPLANGGSPYFGTSLHPNWDGLQPLPLMPHPGLQTGPFIPHPGLQTGPFIPHPGLQTGPFIPHPGLQTVPFIPHPGDFQDPSVYPFDHIPGTVPVVDPNYYPSLGYPHNIHDPSLPTYNNYEHPVLPSNLYGDGHNPYYRPVLNHVDNNFFYANPNVGQLHPQRPGLFINHGYQAGQPILMH